MSKSQQVSLDEEMWAQALAEFEGDSRRPGLWAKSYADAQGNEAVAKASYLSQRVSELRQERIDKETKLRQEHIDHEAKKEKKRDDLRKILGISFDGKRYRVNNKSCDSFDDAINEAAIGYDELGYTLLSKAVTAGDIDLVKTLISLGANPKLTEGNSGNATALSSAVMLLEQAEDQSSQKTYQMILDLLNEEGDDEDEEEDEEYDYEDDDEDDGEEYDYEDDDEDDGEEYDYEDDDEDEDEDDDGTPHPWRRLFARITDSLFFIPIVYMLFMVVLFTVFNQFPHAMQDPQSVINRFYKLIEERPGSDFIVFVPIFILLWILLEAAFISLVRATPGKWIFGIRVISRTGDKLSYANAVKRAFLVFVQGEGLGIPIVNIFTGIFAYLRLKRTETTLWDTSVGSIVTYKKWGVIRAIVSVLFVLVSLFFLVVLNSMGKT